MRRIYKLIAGFLSSALYANRPVTRREETTTPLSKLSESELRDRCRAQLEMVELWLRRLVHDRFEQEYSKDILHAVNERGEFVVKKDLRESLKVKLSSQPGRYVRAIDAAYLDDLITIVCKPETYRRCFDQALGTAFPGKADEARTFLTRLIAPRNSLSHANPISIRQAEQVICYTNDVVDSLKRFYALNMRADEYNAPRIMRMWDTFGNMEFAATSPKGGQHFNYSEKPSCFLYPGDTLTIELEIDPSLSQESYSLEWNINLFSVSKVRQTKLVLPIQVSHIGQHFRIHAFLMSHESWHRFSVYDDAWSFTYRVLPPPTR